MNNQVQNLPSVTLIACDGDAPNRTVRVLNHCARLFKFAAVTLAASEPPTIPFCGRWLHRDTGTYEKAMRYEIAGLAADVYTPHALFVSHDGWILNPQLWRDEWLDLDMIGAPWPHAWGTHHRVGNTGFSLRSKRFLEAVASALPLHAGQVGDIFACRTLRRPLEEMGMRYATVAQAGSYSWEHYVEDAESGPAVSFGFHGWVAGKTPDQFEKLMSNDQAHP